MSTETRYQQSNDEYATPKWLKEDLFNRWYDPCPLSKLCNTKIDGLKVAWQDYTFINPPYSNPLPWIEKAIQEHKKGKTIALLLKHDSSTKWFKLLHETKAEFLLFSGRLHFNESKNSAPFPSLLAILPRSHNNFCCLECKHYDHNTYCDQCEEYSEYEQMEPQP